MSRIDLIHGDRRAERRYEYRMEVTFRYTFAGLAHTGAGHTVDLSRSGVRFVADCPPPRNAYVEMRMAWPFLLQNVCPLELVVRGTVQNSSERGTILMIEDHEFRTCGSRSFAQAEIAGCSSIVA